MLDWAVLLTLFAAATNVGTACILWRLGIVDRRRSQLQDDVNAMIYERVRMLEISLSIYEHKKDID